MTMKYELGTTSITIFAFIGALATLTAIIFFIVWVVGLIIQFIAEKKYKYNLKHRFDKPPTAKCYCAFCQYWRKSDGYCSYFKDRNTADSWFCWNAEPLSQKEYNRGYWKENEDGRKIYN